MKGQQSSKPSDQPVLMPIQIIISSSHPSSRLSYFPSVSPTRNNLNPSIGPTESAADNHIFYFSTSPSNFPSPLTSPSEDYDMKAFFDMGYVIISTVCLLLCAKSVYYTFRRILRWIRISKKSSIRQCDSLSIYLQQHQQNYQETLQDIRFISC